MTPKIAMLIASPTTQAALRAWALREGFDLTQTHGGRQITDDMFDFHVTLLATANPISAPETDHETNALMLTPTSFDLLGADASTPVITVEADDALNLMRSWFTEVYGAEPTFEEFRPHISLSYNWHGAPALDALNLPDFPLVFDRLVVTEFEVEQKHRLLSRPRGQYGAHWVYR